MIFGLVTGLVGKLAGGLFGGNKAAAGGSLIVLLALGGYIGMLKFDNARLENKIGELRNEVKELQLDVEIEKGNLRACQSRIDESNKRIDDLKEAGSQNQKVIDMLGENITVFKEASDARIENLRNAPTPQSCEEAMQFLRNGIGDSR